MKVGGTLRILVPDLEASAKAYLKKDKKFFKFSKHYNDKLGIAGNFKANRFSRWANNSNKQRF